MDDTFAGILLPEGTVGKDALGAVLRSAASAAGPWWGDDPDALADARTSRFGAEALARRWGDALEAEAEILDIPSVGRVMAARVRFGSGWERHKVTELTGHQAAREAAYGPRIVLRRGGKV